jgi:hypothetical protein
MREIGKIATVSAFNKKHNDLPVMAANTNVTRLEAVTDADLMSFKYEKKETDNPTLSQMNSSPIKRIYAELDPSLRQGDFKDSIPVSDISHLPRSKFSKFSANEAVFDLINIEEMSEGVSTNKLAKPDRHSDHSSDYYTVKPRMGSYGGLPTHDIDMRDPFLKEDNACSNRETIIGTRLPSVSEKQNVLRRRNQPSQDREYCYCHCRVI